MVEHCYFDLNTNQLVTNGAAAQEPAPEAALPDARQLWREAVAVVAAKAKATLPQSHGRIDSAVAIVLAGDVAFQDDGTAQVGSQSSGEVKYYVVNGACECRDFARAPDNFCKHRLAYGIAKRAQARLEASMDHLDATPAGEVVSVQRAEDSQTSPLSSVHVPNCPLPEAPASANVFVLLDGHRVQITVRGFCLAGVLTEIRTVLAQFPAEAAAAPVAPPQAPAAPPTDEATPDRGPGQGWCAVHQTQMRWNAPKPGDTRPGWWSHKTATGAWCKGKAPRAGR